MSVNPIPSQNEYKPFSHKVVAFVSDPLVQFVAFSILCVVVTAVAAPFTAAVITGGVIAVIGAVTLLGAYVYSRSLAEEDEETPTSTNTATANLPAEMSAGEEDDLESVASESSLDEETETESSSNRSKAETSEDSTAFYSGREEFSRSSSATSSDAPYYSAREGFLSHSSEDTFHSVSEEFADQAHLGTDSSSETSDDGSTAKFPTDAPHVIKAGIMNIRDGGKFGNSCWLNSTLKFIASTDYYDSMLNGNEPELRTALRSVVETLRAEDEILDTDLYLDLQDKIGKQMPEFKVDGSQRDAQEFLMSLTEQLGWIPPEKVTAVQYSDDTAEQTASENDAVVMVQAPRSNEFDLAKILLDPKTHKSEIVGGFQEEQIRTVFTSLPEHLMVYLKIEDVDTEIAPKILADKKEIVLYESYFDEDGLPAVKKKVTYSVESAIQHRGSDKSGHYTCLIRNEDALELHDDTEIRKNVQLEEFDVVGYLIHLKKIDEEMINDSSS